MDELDIHFETSDGVRFVVNKSNIRPCSKTICNLMEDVATTSADAPIPLPNLTGAIFERVVVWCKEHVNDAAADAVPAEPKKAKTTTTASSSTKMSMSAFDEQFTRAMDMDTIFELIIAASYLDIPPLLDLCTLAIALRVQGKTADEVKTEFGTNKGADV